MTTTEPITLLDLAAGLTLLIVIIVTGGMKNKMKLVKRSRNETN